VNTLSHKYDSFSNKLCGNPLAWRSRARSMPECPVVDHDAGSNVSQHAASAVADMHALRQELLGDLTTVGAGLTCASWINADDNTTSFFSFVGRECDDLCPQGVVDVFGQHPTCQAFDVEIFERDLAEPFDQISAEFVGEVTASAGDVPLVDGKAPPCFGAPLRAASGPCKFTLSPPQTLGVNLREVGAGNCLAGRHCNQVGQAEIDANTLPINSIGTFDFDMKDDVPLAEAAGEDRGFGFARQFAVPLHLDLARHPNNGQTVALSDREAIADTEICRVETAGRSKPGETRLITALDPLEECIEGFLQASNDLLFGAERPASEIRLSGAACFQLIRLINKTKAFSGALPSFNALLQAGVVKATEITKHLVERFGLGSISEQPIFVGQDHSDALLIFDIAPDCFLADFAGCRGEVRSRPKCWQSGFERRELFPKDSAGAAFEAIDHFGDANDRISFDEQMNVIGHYFHRPDRHVVLSCDLKKQLFQPLVNWGLKHASAVFRAPHQVVPQSKNRTGVLRVSGHSNNRHTPDTNCNSFLGRAFLCQLKQTVPCAIF